MRGRPRTNVVICVDPIDTRLASFSLDDMGPALSRIVQRRTRATQRQTLATFVCANSAAHLTEQLNHAWALLALRGAVLLYAGVPGPRSVAVTPCHDPLLVLNVLARARGTVSGI